MNHALTSEELLARAVTAGVPAQDLPTSVATNRYVGVAGMLNVRQLGGIAVDGGHIRNNVLFRSDHLHEVTPAGEAMLAALKLRHVYDFRLPVEQARQPSKLPAGVPVSHLATGDMSAAEDMVAKIPNMLTGVEPIAPADWWDDNYVDMLDRAADMFVSLAAGLAQVEGVPALFHCTGGKDRTGMAAMIVLHTLGADDDAIIDDFLATNVFRTPLRLPHWEPQFEAAGITKQQAMPILGVTRSGITAALAELKRLGGGEAYLRQGGLTSGQLDQLRVNLVNSSSNT
jgi:protein-tyrosine phosphatase